ncbi:flavonoid 3'-monooxygenase CYP75B137-like [Rhodamnia argentea]|uniref:Flavonoid 3'-monooxygenase CYP75B137-like n=1 Tax=Rhodamnia argentea TaxID=178133 RepID=A0A8B8NQD6_9MYRT|nr:flavonoid 3'-monooxygenase CYP75B137-like [Rhodamnia argentea]
MSSSISLPLLHDLESSLSWHDVSLPSLLLLLSAAFAIGRWAWRRFAQKKNSPSLPPGPAGLPLVGNLPFLDPELHTYFATLATTYGPVLKLQLGRKLGVVVTSPATAREVLKDNDVTFANRDVPIAGRTAFYGLSDILWSPYGPEWRMLRKVCGLKMLSNHALDSVYELRRREVQKTVGYFWLRAGSPVNVGEQMFLTVLNVITSMLWGGTVRGEDRESLGADFKQAISNLTKLLGKPNISDFYPSLARFDLQGIERQMKGLAKRFDGIFEKMIEQRLKMQRDGGIEESKDFLQFLLEWKDEEDAKTPLTMTGLKGLLMDMLVGGTDSSSNTIEFAMAEIMNKPSVLRKIQQELETVVGKDNVVEESHIPKLPYLQAAMKESLRLHPPVPLLIPHCPSATCTVGGYTVPKGSRVFINVWAIHRDPSIWSDPQEFDPDRFLHGEVGFNGQDFNYLPFGSGRRTCVGILMAERTVLYSLATFLHSFDWKLPEGEKMDLTEQFGIVMKKKKPLMAVPSPRFSDPRLYE